MKTRINKGFTLLEILLVITAIGILASIVIVAINPLRQIGKAENAGRWGGINTIQEALEQYNIANGKYPDDIPSGSYEEICDTGGETEGGETDCTDKVDFRTLVPSYIGGIPKDPNGGGYKVGINPLNSQISVWADKAKLGDLIVINPIELALVIGGTNEVGQTLSIDLIANGLENIDPNNIIWYRGTTQVGTGASYTVQSGDVGSEIIAKLVLGGTDFASGSGGIVTELVFSSGDRDNSFNIGTGFNAQVYPIVLQSDEKIILGGAFSTYQGVSANRIIRLNSDGTRDNGFNIGTGFSGFWINSIAIQNDGKLVMGGMIDSYQGVLAGRIIRLNSDGTRDNTFDMGIGFENGSVNSIKIQNDGKIIIGGGFSTYQGVSANRIIRLNSDGTRDNSFDIGTGFNSSVDLVFIQNDGKLVIGGNFTTYQGVSANRIIRLNSDGTRDNSFDIGTGFGNSVSAIEIQNDGKFVIGGNFTTYQGASANRIIRLNSDGTRDNTFDTGTGFSSTVLTIKIQNDGKLVIGGNFTTYQGVSANRIIRLNSDGTRDNGFNVGTGFSDAVNTIFIQNDGKLVIGGNFFTYKGISVNRIVRLE